MKLIALALLTGLAAAGSALSQTAPSPAPPQAPAPPSAPADSSSGPAAKIDRSCRKEIMDLCGHGHGQEMRACVKSGLDMNKFSASCKSEIEAQKSKSPSS